MNSRERMLTVVLVSIVGCFVVFLGLWQFLWKPFDEYRQDNLRLEEANTKLASDISRFKMDQKRMAQARLKSLPVDRNFAITEYSVRFLRPLFKSAGVKVDEIVPAPTLTEVRPPAKMPGVKTVGHKTMTFLVNARGELPQIIDALEMIKYAPYEHRIKSVSIDRVSTSTAQDASKQLKMTMILETLIVAKALAKPGMIPGIDPRSLLTDVLLARYAPFGGFGAIASETFALTCVPSPSINRPADWAAKSQAV